MGVLNLQPASGVRGLAEDVRLWCAHAVVSGGSPRVGLACLRFLLGGLDLLPELLYLGSAADADGAEDVRMTADHLFGDAANNLRDREGAAVVGHLCVQDNLEEQVAQLFA